MYARFRRSPEIEDGFVQISIDGLITGLTIAVMALAFTVVYLPTHIFYIALAGIYATVDLGVVLAAVMSLAISLPAIRFKGDFFVLVSLAVQTLLFSLLYNWSIPSAGEHPTF